MDQVSSTKILGVRVDRVNNQQVLEIIDKWMDDGGKHYIVTPNVEFIMAAQKDKQFKKILNKADLAVADSSRIGWAEKISKFKNPLSKILLLPFILYPKLINDFPVVTGTDLMQLLCKEGSEKGYSIGLLGGGENVAKKTEECLKKLYPNLKITFAEAGGSVDDNGNWQEEDFNLKISKTDILFVAFGQVKQEKWIVNNLDKLDIKVAMGVGGAFDYISGEVPRAPKILRSLGFEWLFRLIIQPWRIKRQIILIKFVWKILKIK